MPDLNRASPSNFDRQEGEIRYSNGLARSVGLVVEMREASPIPADLRVIPFLCFDLFLFRVLPAYGRGGLGSHPGYVRSWSVKIA